jgi:hypothetical protein
VEKSFYLVKEVIRSSPDQKMMDLLRKLLTLECTVSALKENKSQPYSPCAEDFFPTEITAALIQTGNTSALQIMGELIPEIKVLFDELKESIYKQSMATNNDFLEGLIINLHYPIARVATLPYPVLIRRERPVNAPYKLHILEDHPAELSSFRHQLYTLRQDSTRAYFVNSACQNERIFLEDALRERIHKTQQTTLDIDHNQLSVVLEKNPECLLLGSRLGSGDFGTVKQVMFAVKHTRSGTLECIFHGSQGKTQVVKSIVEHKMKMREYTVGKRAPQLKMKPPVLFQKYYHLPMRKLPGIPLSDLLREMTKNPGKYSWSFRRTLSLKLLRALKEQVLDLDMCHRDIKPENIIVYIRDDEIEVNILDYGFVNELSAMTNGPKKAPLFIVRLNFSKKYQEQPKVSCFLWQGLSN